MKLKKIASLMLAGVMAVSMLAGCQNANVDPEPTPNPDPTPSANYGTTFYSYLSSDAQKKMTFGSNADNVSPLSLRDIPPSGGTSWKRLLLLYGYNRRSRFLSLPYRCLAVTHGRALGSPRGRAVERSETERANVAAPPWGLQTASGSFYCNHTAKGAVFHFFPLDSGLSMVYITR